MRVTAALSLGKMLERATGAGSCPLRVGAPFWLRMKKHLRRDVRQETRVEYLSEGAMGTWRGRWVFVVPAGDLKGDESRNRPSAFPAGEKIIRKIEKRGL